MKRLEDFVRSLALICIFMFIPLILLWVWSEYELYAKVLATDLCIFLCCLLTKYYVIDE